MVDAVEPRIRELLRAFPTMPATVIAERVGWDRGMTVFARPGPASCGRCICRRTRRRRTSYVAGEIAQCDFWFPDIELPVGCGQIRDRDAAAGVDDGVRLLPLAVGAADPARAARRTCSPAGGSSCERWGRCRGCWSGTARARSAGGGRGSSELTADCQAFRGTLGAKVVICRPADPEAKGLVERAHDYLETLVPARPHVHLAGRLQHPAAGVARAGQPRRHGGCWAAPRRTGSTRTGRRCWPCRRWRRRPAGGPAPGWPATTTSGWTATTTRCTRR